MTAIYEPSEAGWAKIQLSPQILAACVAEAERGKVFAQGISPRSTDEERSQFADRFDDPSILTRKAYADSFDVQPGITNDFREPRVAARLVNEADHAAAVEFGNRVTPKAHRVLGRTAAYLGDG